MKSLAKIYQQIGLPFTSQDENRWTKCQVEFEQKFPSTPMFGFSVPGRTEIGGNHTDHQLGKVLAAAIDQDMIACVGPSENTMITIISDGYEIEPINIGDLSLKTSEYGTSMALVRGVCAALQQKGYTLGGFNMMMTSDILPGAGVSSSAAFEIMIAMVISTLFNQSRIELTEMALVAQYAENIYFNKPCGLMDQMACAIGGLLMIDFQNQQQPTYQKSQIDLEQFGYTLCIINTGGSHADLSDEYSAIPTEMKQVAQYFKAHTLSEVQIIDFFNHISELRQVCSDRAILRAFHFLYENQRVTYQFEALSEGRIDDFLEYITQSGLSSALYLQNIMAFSNPLNQPIALGYALCDALLNKQGAYRVHGGGFAGTLQAFVPHKLLVEFKQEMERVFGVDSCKISRIRPIGAVHLF